MSSFSLFLNVRETVGLGRTLLALIVFVAGATYCPLHLQAEDMAHVDR